MSAGTPEGREQGPEDREGQWRGRGVVAVAAASFFSDSGHELASSILPAFLTSTLHAGPAALGAIEGVSDALIGVSKLAGGQLAADPQRRGRLARGGYLVTAAATGALGLTVAVWQVAVLRAAAWVARGLRGPARDMIVTSLVPPSAYGRAFGLERAGDNAGAIVGPLLASLLVSVLGLRHVLLLSVVPGILAAASITFAAGRTRATLADADGRRTLRLNLGELRRAGLARALTPAALFELGNLATTLLILRASTLLHHGSRSLTAATSLAILMYAAHNGAATLASFAGGHLSDRLSARTAFTLGAGLYVVSYATFAWEQHAPAVLLAAFLLSGAGIGLAETAESTVVAQLLPERLRSNGFGVLGLTQSFGDLGATLVVGLLWSAISPTVGFAYAACWMVASVLASVLLRPQPPGRTSA